METRLFTLICSAFPFALMAEIDGNHTIDPMMHGCMVCCKGWYRI
jgi:hypothetical protein